MPQDQEQYAYQQQDLISALQESNWNKYVLENKDLLENIGHLLMGEIMKPVKVKIDGEEVMELQWVKPANKLPPINDDGYYFTMLHVTQALDKSQATGNLSEEQVMNSINQLMKSIANVYTIKYAEFGFQTPSETRTLLVSIMLLLKSHLSKSKDMALIKQLASSYNISEQRISGLPRDEQNLSM
jgi:hypothetical protein